MSKYGFSDKEITALKAKLRRTFDLDEDEPIPDEAVLVNWEPRPTPGEIEKAKELAEKIQDSQRGSKLSDEDESWRRRFKYGWRLFDTSAKRDFSDDVDKKE